MDTIINLFLAFIEGLGIIISPCILPILPILFATGIVGGKNRPYGIMLGFIVAFCLFTLFARAIVISTGINLDLIRNISFMVLLFLAIIMMSTYLSNLFFKLTAPISRLGASFSSKQKDTAGGFLDGVLIGLPIGLIWTPCAGPIIAAVILQTIRAKTNFETMLILLAFSVGVAIPVLFITLVGRKLLNSYSFLTKHTVSIRKILGGILFLVLILSMQGMLYIETADVPASPQQLKSDKIINSLSQAYPAPEIQNGTSWINSQPLKVSNLKGKVVLIDFWTYSCINCLRTLPYLMAWDKKYRREGLVIIGVHSPEFAFEQKLENVKNAVKKWGINYPITLDNQLETWASYNNHFWPAHYLINKQGNVVYTHFGEGQYDITEHNIQVLLGQKTGPETMSKVGKHSHGTSSFTSMTPETYLGSDRAVRFEGKLLASKNSYEFPSLLPQDCWALQGKWQITPQSVISESKGSAIKLHFQAQKIFLVLGSQDQKIKTAHVLLNGKPLGNLAGKAIKNNQLIIKEDTLYELLNLPKQGSGILEIIFEEPGTEAYAFTFG